MDFDFNLGSRTSATEREPDAPLRLLVIGDFSGHLPAGDFSLQKPVRIDIDNFEQVLAKLNPKVSLRLGEFDSALSFASMDDFHPDQLLSRVSAFAEIERLTRGAPSAQSPAPGARATESEAATLGRLLGVDPDATGTTGPGARGFGGIDLDAMIRSAVAPHITTGEDPGVRELAKTVDTARAIAMRELLHDTEFQHLEAAWRALHWLVFEHEAGEALEVSVLDVSKGRLAQDIETHRTDLRTSHLYRLLVTDAHGGFGGQSYSTLVGDYSFGPGAADIQLLAGIGAIATHAGAPFIAGAEPALLGGAELSGASDPTRWPRPTGEAATLWQALRECAQARYIGLVLGRVIGRVPYGGRGEAIEGFEFNELGDTPMHDDFLWLNGAFACAQLITAAFAEAAWSMELGDVLELSDLPAALYEADEGPALKASAEIHLSRAGGAHLLEQGAMALMSHRDANVIRLAGFQSVASPQAALAGPWSRN